MKNTILLFIFFFSIQLQLKAQNAPLNKQQTVEYIEKVYKSTYKFQEFKVSSVVLDSKTLALTYSDGEVLRKDLSLPEHLKISNNDHGYMVAFDTIKQNVILGCIQIESDAIRLKKALEHLIEILKTEKNTDPFGE